MVKSGVKTEGTVDSRVYTLSWISRVAGEFWLVLVEFEEPFFALEAQLSRVKKFVNIYMKACISIPLSIIKFTRVVKVNRHLLRRESHVLQNPFLLDENMYLIIEKSISTNHEQAANTTKPNSLETEPNEPTRISTAKLYKTL